MGERENGKREAERQRVRTKSLLPAKWAGCPGHTNHGEENEESAGKVMTTANGGQVYAEAADPGAANQGSCAERRDRARWQGPLSGLMENRTLVCKAGERKRQMKWDTAINWPFNMQWFAYFWRRGSHQRSVLCLGEGLGESGGDAPPRNLPMRSAYSEGQGEEEREMEGNRDKPRIDPGGALIFKERVGFLFLYRFCWLWFSDSLEGNSRLDTNLSLKCWLVNC